MTSSFVDSVALSAFGLEDLLSSFGIAGGGFVKARHGVGMRLRSDLRARVRRVSRRMKKPFFVFCFNLYQRTA